MRLAVCALTIAFAAVVSGGDPKGNRHRRSAGVFLSIVGEKPRDNSNVPASVLPVQLPIQLGGHGGVTLPVLVLPVPVYTQAPDTCDANHNHGEVPEAGPGSGSSSHKYPPVKSPPYVAIRQQFGSNAESQQNEQPANSFNQFNQELVDPQPVNHQRPVKDLFSSIASGVPSSQGHNEQRPGSFNPIKSVLSPRPIQNAIPPRGNLNLNPFSNIPSPPPIPNVVPSRGSFEINHGAGGSKVNFGLGSSNAASTPYNGPQVDFGVQVSAPAPVEVPIPYSKGLFDQLFETSTQMVQSFRRQAPVAPELPAVLPDRYLPDRIPATAPGSSVDALPIPAPAPPHPRFDRSLQLRVDLTVPRADYTEAFNTEWHADSKTSRTVVEDGGTTIYRAPLPDGRVQFLEIRVDRSGGNEVRRCTLSPLMPPSAADQAFPGLPDMDQFEFTGYTTAEGQSLVERWQRVVAGGAGEGGAAQGESLTTTHEMLVTRDSGDAVPLRYSVVTDSSVLGQASDSYTHRFRAQRGPSAAVLPDTTKECDVLEEMPQPDHQDKDARAEAVARFDPLREFALPTRDIRYDSVLQKYKSLFQRNYLDLAEEAVRKNLLTQHSRFVAAGNRLASTFELAVNFLADRLDDELEKLFGVIQPAEGTDEPGLIPFPYSDEDVKDISDKLPDEFDWRPRGAVSPVRFQGTTCSSCWAFAVAGATEGALFKKTNRLVPLSPQCLVDCGRPYGANGCNGTWPSFAYDYVKDRGLPAWDEYTDYQAKVLECKDRSVPPVTHISAHVNVTANSVPALKVAIKKHAPNVVIVDAKAKSFILYSKGVLKDQRCGQNRPVLNHAVLAVGWGKQDGEHFIVKNSWTEKWGEQGFIRIDPGSCALLQRPSYPLLTEPNIDREELRAAAASVKEED